VKIRSTIRKGAGVALATATASGISHAAATVTNGALHTASGLLPEVAPALSAPGLDTLQRLAGGPRLGLAAGAITGLGMACGAAFGTDKVEMTDAPLWKKILVKPALDTYNKGIDFRQNVREARAEEQWQPAFRKGANAGWTVGATLGRTAGTIQGGITGSILGLELSGEAFGLLTVALEGTPLPPLIQQSLPYIVGGACLFTGQAVGSALGGAVGSVVGGSIGGVGVGTYTALTRKES
jgi:hypothetical protein